MPRGVFDLDRQEGPCPDMQGYPVDSDPALAERGFQRRREMQSRRRRRDSAFAGGEHGLIVGGVALIGRTPGGDIGWQRRAAEIGDGGIERGPVKGKRQRDLTILALVLHLGVEMAEKAHPALIAKANHVTR
ncbi:hypothetical protein GALL_500670 [mine drainage metagenome]|uniref:Uncharacterized protein n=1 Tax=mine drainage metagenome TaxID=410659 RepID=A0A1J5PC70_9ZZZZ